MSKKSVLISGFDYEGCIGLMAKEGNLRNSIRDFGYDCFENRKFNQNLLLIEQISSN